MPPKHPQVNGNHVPAALAPPKIDNPTVKKRTAPALESSRLGKQRRLSKEEADNAPLSVLQGSTSRIRKSRRANPTTTQPTSPEEEDEDDEQIRPHSERAQGKKGNAGPDAQECTVTISPKKIRKTKATIVKEEEEVGTVESTRGSRTLKKTETTVVVEQEEITVGRSANKSREVKSTGASVLLKEEEVEPADDATKKVKRRRKTKEEKEAEAMPLAGRTNGMRMFVGAHVSSAKGE